MQRILYMYLGAIIIFSFIYFLIIRATNKYNYKRKSLQIFIVGTIVFLFFLGGWIYDNVAKDLDIFSYPAREVIYYFAFLIVSFIFDVTFSLMYFIKGIKSHQIAYYKNTYERAPRTIKDKKMYLYLVFKYQDNYLLFEDEKDKEKYYKGEVIKFPRNEFFHDELIEKIIKNYNCSKEFYGTLTKKSKKDFVYYCYVIELLELNENLKDYIMIDKKDVVKYNMEMMDKKIYYRIIIKEKFEIEENE